MSDFDVTMPQLGETVAEGTVSRWLVAVGSTVRIGDPVLEVSTDKVDTEVVAPADGTLTRIVVPEGETVPVGALLAVLGIQDQVTDAQQAVPDTDLTEEGPASMPSRSSPIAVPTPTLVNGHRHRHSPRVRRLAEDHGVDLESVEASGRHGRATEEDVRAAVSRRDSQPRAETAAETPSTTRAAAPVERQRSATSARGQVEPLSRRRRVIAERMHRSLQESAQLTTVVEVDLTRVVLAREAAKEAFQRRYASSLSVLAFVAEAAVRALGEHPLIHAELDLDAGTVTYPSRVDLGIAVDTEQGLVVPVIPAADDLSVGGLARRIAELAQRARDGSATADDFAGGTFTITNTGSRGALFDTPILNAPQVAILGLGAVTRRPAAMVGADGSELIAVRSMAYFSLTYDHRLVDGADAARFLVTLKERLETNDRVWTEAVGVQEARA